MSLMSFHIISYRQAALYLAFLFAVVSIPEISYAGGWGCSAGTFTLSGEIMDFKHENDQVSFIFSGKTTNSIPAASKALLPPENTLTQVPVLVGRTSFLSLEDMTWSISFEKEPQLVKKCLSENRNFRICVKKEKLSLDDSGLIAKIDGEAAIIFGCDKNNSGYNH